MWQQLMQIMESIISILPMAHIIAQIIPAMIDNDNLSRNNLNKYKNLHHFNIQADFRAYFVLKQCGKMCNLSQQFSLFFIFLLFDK